MKFNPPLQEAILIRRYKRFLADVETTDGQQLTIHCPNTGSMLNCDMSGSRVWYSTSANPKRKYRHTWELIETSPGHLAGINTGRANALVAQALQDGVIEQLQGYDQVRREASYGAEGSRIDFLLSTSGSARQPDCYVEVKSVTLLMHEGLGVFPDAVTSRGQKHLRELMAVAEQGDRAVLLFCVQHSGIQSVRPADQIDPEYGQLLRQAVSRGVEILAFGVVMSVNEMKLQHQLPVYLND